MTRCENGRRAWERREIDNIMLSRGSHALSGFMEALAASNPKEFLMKFYSPSVAALRMRGLVRRCSKEEAKLRPNMIIHGENCRILARGERRKEKARQAVFHDLAKAGIATDMCLPPRREVTEAQTVRKPGLPPRLESQCYPRFPPKAAPPGSIFLETSHRPAEEDGKTLKCSVFLCAPKSQRRRKDTLYYLSECNVAEPRPLGHWGVAKLINSEGESDFALSTVDAYKRPSLLFPAAKFANKSTRTAAYNVFAQQLIPRTKKKCKRLKVKLTKRSAGTFCATAAAAATMTMNALQAKTADSRTRRGMKSRCRTKRERRLDLIQAYRAPL